MKLKENSTTQKLRGGYYTPKILADFIVKQINKNNKSLKVLEPSCGDGVFLDSIKENISADSIDCVKAIEIVLEEAEKVKKRNIGIQYRIYNEDFLDYYHNNRNEKYDIILGNPPYIRYQYLTPEQRKIQSEILTNNGMKPNKLINSWVCFLVACVELLADKGSIGFIIPAELLQVVYAEELRKFLSNQLARITLITFKELVFPDIEQEVIVLLGDKDRGVNRTETKISVIEFNNFDDMENFRYTENEYQLIEHTQEKWTKYFLSENENNLIRSLRNDKRFFKFDDIAIVNVGITTGNNKYFSVNKDIVEKYQLHDITLPLIGRSSHAHGIYFTNEDWKHNIEKDARAFLIHFPEDIAYEDYPDSYKEYIQNGDGNGENRGYKCRIRDRWYIVPSVWVPDAFILRRNNTFPKFVVNKIDAVSTDTMHRIKFHDGIDRDKVLLSYYNSITLAFTEINGRSYGGGVLEILPREVGAVILPNIQSMDSNKAKELLGVVDEYIRNNKNIEELLAITDKIILHDYLGISQEVTADFRSIWKKLMKRRHVRSR